MKRSASSSFWKAHAGELTTLALVLVSVAVFGLLNPGFISLDVAKALLEGASTDGLMVIGMTIVIVCGGFDLSVGSTTAVSGLTAAVLMKSGVPVTVAVLAALLVGVLVGLVNGLFVTRLKINPFITTLGTMSVLRGIALVSTRSMPPTGFPQSFLDIAWGSVLGIPIPVIVLIAATIFADLFLRHLRYLRQVYFVGSNEDAAALTGISVAGVRTFAFVITGFLAALAGVIIAARANAVDPNGGTGAELRVIAAVIVGGASLSGGRGTILGSFLGLLLMQIITTGLVFINVAPEAQFIAVGLVLIFAAIIDRAGWKIGRNLIALLTRTRSRKVERIINVLLAVALIVVIALKFGSGGNDQIKPVSGGADTSNQRYVMIAAVTGGPYWIDSKAGLYDKAKELGVHAEFTGPPTVDVNSQIDAVNRAIARRVDGIIAVPMSDALTPAINKAIEQGIPVVCADADAPSSNRYFYIGTGNYNAGYLGGSILAKAMGGRGEVAIITVPGLDNLGQRVNGYLAAFKKYPGIKVVATGNDQGSQTEAQKVCRTILQAHPNLRGFGAVAAIGGQGAAVAVKQLGKTGKVKIVAMDRDEATLQFVEEGIIDATICQRSYTMSYVALQMLYNLRNKQIRLVDDWKKVGINPLPTEIDTGSFAVTRKNAKFFHHQAR